MPRHFWSAEDMKVLCRLYPWHPTDWVAGQLGRSLSAVNGLATKLRLHKDAGYKAQAFRACGLQLQQHGLAHRFPKGHVPMNKGLRRPGWFRGRMRETQFKKGHRRRDTHVIGAERIIDGYLYIKVADVPCVPYSVNWKPVHILNWERANGRPLPPGHCLAFRDRDRMNVAVENLELITRAENMRRNSVHNLPAELAQVVQLRGALVRKINRRVKSGARHEKQD